MPGNEKNGAGELPQHSGREGERGLHPTARKRLMKRK
jgi:hypothetical protein